MARCGLPSLRTAADSLIALSKSPGLSSYSRDQNAACAKSSCVSILSRISRVAAKNDVTASAKIIDIHITRPEGWEALSRQLTQAQRNFAEARQFTGGAGQKLQMPNAEGVIESVLYGAGPMSKDELGAMRAGGLSGSLTQGFYRFASLPQDWDSNLAPPVIWGQTRYISRRQI